MMKVAIPSDHQDEAGEIYPFFGQAKYFFIYEMLKGESRLQETRENPASDVIRGLSHAKKPPAILQMINDYLSDCDVFVSVGINNKIADHLVSKGKEIVLVEKEKIRELAGRIAKGEA